MKLNWLMAIAAGLISTSVRADVILWTDFTGVNTSGGGSTATGISWTEDDVSLSSPDLTFTGIKKSDGTSYIPFFFSNKGTPANNIQVNANIETLGAWSTGFTITPTETINLTNFTLDYRAISNTAVDQSAARSALYTLVITQGATSLGSFADGVTDPGGSTPAGDTANIDLSSLTLSSNLAYTFTLTVSSSSNLGNNVAIDNLGLNGTPIVTPVPEPGITGVALGIFGFIVLTARRRSRYRASI